MTQIKHDSVAAYLDWMAVGASGAAGRQQHSGAKRATVEARILRQALKIVRSWGPTQLEVSDDEPAE